MMEGQIVNSMKVQLWTPGEEGSVFFGFLGNLRCPHTQVAYKRDLEVFAQFLREKIPGANFLSVRHEHVVAYRQFLEKFGGREGQSASDKTVNRRISALREFYRFLCQLQLLERNPLEFIDLLKVHPGVKTEPLTSEQWKKLMEGNPRASFTERFHQAVVAMLFTTGMRKSELINLKLGSLRRIEGLLVLEYKAKGSKVLRKPLHEKCAHFLLFYLRQCRDRGLVMDANEWMFRGTQAKGGGGIGGKINASTLDYIIKKAGRKLGIPEEKMHPHRARATVITLLHRQQVDLKSIQDYVGHSHPQMTGEYIKRDECLRESPVFSL